MRISEQQVYRLFDKGELLGYKVGAKRLIYKESIEQFKITHGNQAVKKAALEEQPQDKPQVLTHLTGRGGRL